MFLENGECSWQTRYCRYSGDGTATCSHTHLACVLLLLAQPLALFPLVLADCTSYASGCGSILRYFFALVSPCSGIAYSSPSTVCSALAHNRGAPLLVMLSCGRSQELEDSICYTSSGAATKHNTFWAVCIWRALDRCNLYIQQRYQSACCCPLNHLQAPGD